MIEIQLHGWRDGEHGDQEATEHDASDVVGWCVIVKDCLPNGDIELLADDDYSTLEAAQEALELKRSEHPGADVEVY